MPSVPVAIYKCMAKVNEFTVINPFSILVLTSATAWIGLSMQKYEKALSDNA